MELRNCSGDIRTMLAANLLPETVALAWLGQAGFAIRFEQQLVLIDPYLSDSLAAKYRGKKFPHIRMTPSPIAPDAIRGVNAVLCTHRHSDHMDPGTLPAIAQGNPMCCFVVPRAEQASAEQIGLPVDRIILVNAEETVSLTTAIQIQAIPSAHETLKSNDRGEHHFLGYILKFNGITIYHSGDCVPYNGLAERLRQAKIDLAMLPVNGRDECRRSRGVPGNMTFDEAVSLCAEANIPRLVPHHFGMFDFNTVDTAILTEEIQRNATGVAIVLPRFDTRIELGSDL